MGFNVVTFLDRLYGEEQDQSSGPKFVAPPKLQQSDLEPNDLPDNIADWPHNWQDEYEERAAIMEFDGHLRREEAEQWAETIVRAQYRLFGLAL